MIRRSTKVSILPAGQSFATKPCNPMLKKLSARNFRAIFCLLFSIITFPCAITQPLAIFSVYFDTDVDTLSEEARLKATEQLQRLLPVQDYRAQLIGHTDLRGSLEYNQALSERRAASVQARLVELGFQPARIQSRGRAYLDLAAEGRDEADLARNRRVDVIIEKVDWNVESAYYSIDSRQPARLDYERSGTVISVPGDAFCYPGGRAVEGDIVLMYREFRDPADFISSGLPMNFNRQGQEVYFNSTGMFEVRAFSREGQELELRQGQAVDVDFVQTQVLEQAQFWRFDEEARSWDSGDALIEYEEGEMARVQTGTENRFLGLLPLAWPGSGQWSRTADTVTQLLEAYAMLPELLESAKAYSHSYIPQLDLNRFKHRFSGRLVRGNYAGIYYIGHLSFAEVYSNPKYYNLELETISQDRKGIVARIKDLSGENPELAAFEGVSWALNLKGHSKAEIALLDSLPFKRFSDIRISRKKHRRQYTITLKFGRELIGLDAKLLEINGAHPTDDDLSRAYVQYAMALRQRQLDFDREREETLELLNLFWPCVKLLLPKSVNPDPFQIEGMEAAIRCDKQKDRRNPEWPGLLPGSSWGVLMEELPGYLFMARYAHYFRDYLVGGLSVESSWRQLIREYEASVQGEVPVYKEVYRPFEQPRPRLRLKGMGIFNLDVLKRFEEETQLLARFQDENGQPIRHYRVDVVNHRLNGLLTFKEPSIYLDLKAPTTLVVYGEDGRIFFVGREQMRRLSLQGKSSFTFTAVSVEDNSGRPEVFRKLLSDS